MSGFVGIAEELKRLKAAEEAAAGKNEAPQSTKKSVTPPTRNYESDTYSIRSNNSKKPSLWDRVRGRGKEEPEPPATKRITQSTSGPKKTSLWDNLDLNGGVAPNKKLTTGPKKTSLWDNLDLNGGVEPNNNPTIEETRPDISSGLSSNSAWSGITQEDLIKLKSLKSGNYWNRITDEDIEKLKTKSNWGQITEDDLIKLKELKNKSRWDELTSDDIRKLKEIKESETEYRFQKLQAIHPMGTFISPTMPSVLTNFEPPQFAYAKLPTPNVNSITNFEVNEFKRKYPLVHTVVFSTPPVIYRA